MNDVVDRNALWVAWEAGRSHWAETATAERAEAERLFAEWCGLAPERRGTALRRKKFRSTALVELFLQKSRAALPSDPERADALAMLAGVVLGKLKPEEDGNLAAVLLTRIAWLASNARRLLGDEAQAEAALTTATFALSPDLDACEQAYFTRALALLRWEQGRAAEAVALLTFARRVFRRWEVEGEEMACHALLGLLLTEEGSCEAALHELAAVDCAQMANARPRLAVRAELAKALCLAALGKTMAARAAVGEISRLAAALAERAELVRARWLEGRVWSLLGDAETAASLLREVYQSFLHQKDLPAATLSMLDLAAALAAAGGAEQIESQIEGIERSFSDHAEVEGVLKALRRCTTELETAAAGQAAAHARRAPADAAFLRRVLRLRGYRVEPLPFV